MADMWTVTLRWSKNLCSKSDRFAKYVEFMSTLEVTEVQLRGKICHNCHNQFDKKKQSAVSIYTT
jgi:hypothetical protein